MYHEIVKAAMEDTSLDYYKNREKLVERFNAIFGGDVLKSINNFPSFNFMVSPEAIYFSPGGNKLTIHPLMFYMVGDELRCSNVVTEECCLVENARDILALITKDVDALIQKMQITYSSHELAQNYGHLLDDTIPTPTPTPAGAGEQSGLYL